MAITTGPQFLIAMFPSANGYFFIPTYGSLIAAINFDLSGTTRIGRYVLNHSFMIPGIVATALAVVAGLALWGRIWAAIAMASIDFAISLLLVVIAARSKPGRELDLALEGCGIALRGLEQEAVSVQAELVALREEFRDAKANLAKFVKHPLDTALPALIGPLGTMVLKSLKKRHEPT